MTPLKCWLLLAAVALAGMLSACDPRAPQPTPAAVILPPSATPTPLPTAIPSRTPTRTPTPTWTPTPLPPTPTAPPTATPWTCTATSGQIVDLSFNSVLVGGRVAYRVYLPPCYTETGRRYPYVILMHGSDRDETQWIDYLGVDKALEAGLKLRALPPMILVMPYGGALANTNVFRQDRSWESVVIDELMPEVEKNFCTWNAREGRALGGISRGGFWAFAIGMRHPDLFGAIGGHSPYFDQDHAPPSHNPLFLARNVQFPPGMQPRIWLDVGRDDDTRANIEVFRDLLLDRGIDPGYTMNPTGEHTTEYWAAHVAEYLAFYGQTWPRDIQDLPSCLE